MSLRGARLRVVSGSIDDTTGADVPMLIPGMIMKPGAGGGGP